MMKSNQTNWSKILNNGETANDLAMFSLGVLSGRQIERNLRFTPAAGEFRKLVRSGGVNRARSLAKKALYRRGIISF